MDINELDQYITTFNLINITTKNMAINTGRLWRCQVLGQSEIVCTVAILAVQGDTAISLRRERSLARRRAHSFRRGALGRAARAHIVERTSGMQISSDVIGLKTSLSQAHKYHRGLNRLFKTVSQDDKS